ncbi:MAG: LysR family transcriptional regulator [Proteobacteria bacterium]|nr:LysR family transcriptional regulator [Pseudomonadota bacterium]
MELRHLRYFVAVAEELNFTRAAERLHIGQPPLSQQIQALEEELGAQLFERTKRRVALTPAGQRFLEHARRVLEQAGRAVNDVRRVARGEVGELKIGFTSSLPFTAVLPNVVRRYREQRPDVTLNLREMFTPDQYVAIEAGELDLGFVRYTGLETPAGLDVREIHNDPLRLVINAAHPLASRPMLSLADLHGEGFITYPITVGTGLTILLRELCLKAGFEPRIVQIAGEATTQIGLVAAGLGVALLPAPLECVRIEGVRYLPVSDAGAYLSLGVATRKGDRNPLVEQFLSNLEPAREG